MRSTNSSTAYARTVSTNNQTLNDKMPNTAIIIDARQHHALAVDAVRSAFDSNQEIEVHVLTEGESPYYFLRRELSNIGELGGATRHASVTVHAPGFTGDYSSLTYPETLFQIAGELTSSEVDTVLFMKSIHRLNASLQYKTLRSIAELTVITTFGVYRHGNPHRYIRHTGIFPGKRIDRGIGYYVRPVDLCQMNASPDFPGSLKIAYFKQHYTRGPFVISKDSIQGEAGGMVKGLWWNPNAKDPAKDFFLKAYIEGYELWYLSLMRIGEVDVRPIWKKVVDLLRPKAKGLEV